MRKFKGLLYITFCAALCASLIIPGFAENTGESTAFSQRDASASTPESPAVEPEETIPDDESKYAEDSQTPQTPQEQQVSPLAAESPVPLLPEETGGLPAPSATQEVPGSTAEAALTAAPTVTPTLLEINQEPLQNIPSDPAASPDMPQISAPEAGDGMESSAAMASTDSVEPDMEYTLVNEPLGMEEIDLDDGLPRSVPPKFPEGIRAMGDDETITLTADEVEAILTKLPNGLSDARKSVVIKAYSLVGHVPYCWGGKSTAQGWDERWGNPVYVAVNGAEDEYDLRTYGLDCSGYVSWVFCNAGGTAQTAAIGNGSANQWARSDEICREDVLPGDLAFFAAPGERPINHVGIVVGQNDDGQLMVAHCSSRSNTVVVTEANRTGFKRFRRPNILQDNVFIQSAEHVFLKCCLYAGEQYAQQVQAGKETAASDATSPNGAADQYAFGDSVILKLERAALDGEPPRGIIIGKEGNSWIIAFPVSEGTRVVYAFSEDMERQIDPS